MPDLLWEPQWSLFGFLSQVKWWELNKFMHALRYSCCNIRPMAGERLHYRCCNIRPVKVNKLICRFITFRSLWNLQIEWNVLCVFSLSHFFPLATFLDLICCVWVCLSLQFVVFIYIYIHTYVRMYICMYVCMYGCTYVCIFLFI